jgi:carbohydrate-selective porin OprB
MNFLCHSQFSYSDACLIRFVTECTQPMKRHCNFLTFLVVATATRLVAASLESDWQPIPKLDLAAAIDQEFTKLTNIGITPFIDYYGVLQGNPVGGI